MGSIKLSRCKIPWTNNELKEAERTAAHELSNHLPPESETVSGH